MDDCAWGSRVSLCGLDVRCGGSDARGPVTGIARALGLEGGDVPFFNSTVTVSLAHFIKNLHRDRVSPGSRPSPRASPSRFWRRPRAHPRNRRATYLTSFIVAAPREDGGFLVMWKGCEYGEMALDVVAVRGGRLKLQKLFDRLMTELTANAASRGD